MDLPSLCFCVIYTGTELDADGVKVCERCGKPIAPPADPHCDKDVVTDER